MNYHFDEPINRRNTHSLKWSVPERELPMWVADMDFQTEPEIISALQKRVTHGIFGYTIVPDEWHQAYMDWRSRRHRFQIEKDWLLFCKGAVPAISSTVRKLTHKVNRAINTDEVAEPWLTALREYIEENKRFAVSFLESEIPRLKAIPSQATYLLWIDCRKILGNTAHSFCTFALSAPASKAQ